MRLKELSNISRGFFVVTAFTSFAGFLDASYLTAKKVQGGSINCFVFSGCDAVSNSSYSTIFGLPLALYGAVFYLAVFILSVLFLERRSHKAALAVAGLSGIGVITSAYLLYLQGFVIGSFCSYCVLSAGFSGTIFGAMTIALLSSRRKEN